MAPSAAVKLPSSLMPNSKASEVEDAPAPSFSYAEYREREQASETKHEFRNGKIVAMAGGTPDHARLASNVTAALVAQLRGRKCNVYSADLRVRVLATSLVTYADVNVVCSHLELDPEDATNVLNPIVLVEVLSDSTEKYDRGDKFEHYKRIPSLKEYVLLSQHTPRIEVFRRNDDGSWPLHAAVTGPSGSATLASIGCELSVDEIYSDPFGTGAAR